MVSTRKVWYLLFSVFNCYWQNLSWKDTGHHLQGFLNSRKGWWWWVGGLEILMGQFEPFSKLKTAFCEYWTSIKIKINMTLVSKEYEIKTKIEQEQWLLLKKLFLLVYNLKIYLMGGWGLTFGGRGFFLVGEGWANFWLAGRGLPPHLPVRKTRISTLVWDFFNFKAIYLPCLSY